MAFEVGDDTIDPAGEQAEAAVDTADKKRIEAVETGKDLLVGLGGLIGLFAEEDGVDIGTIEKDDPVAGHGRMEDGDEIDLAGIGGGVAFRPDADGVEIIGQDAVTFLLRGEVVDVLEGGE